MSNTVRKKRKSEIALWEMEAPRSVKTVDTDRSRNDKLRNLRTIDVSQSTGYRNARTVGGRTDKIHRNTQSADLAYIAKRRKARRRRAYFYRSLAIAMLVSCIALIVIVMGAIYKFVNKEDEHRVIPVVNTQTINAVDEDKIVKPDIEVDLLEVNDYSRPATELDKIKSIFVHYTANPGTSAKQNRSYFANLGETHERSASAHFIIGYEGEIIQCIPLEEQAYAVMTRNEDSISIECCYLDEDGKFTQETYDSLVHLLAWLCQEYNLESEDILRHYDCGGKLCPLYYVENEDKWDKLIRDVEKYEQ